MHNETIQHRRARYNLHYLVRKRGFRLVTKKRTVYFPQGKELPSCRALKRLVTEFGYVIQLEIK